MPHQSFSHVETWVFDLDNTLYPPSARLFDQIEVRMTDWVASALDVNHVEANHLRDFYWKKYGTTLAGLMREHDVDPGPYLTDVHDIDFSVLEPDVELAGKIRDLPGHKVVYTNGCVPYARRVLDARGLQDVFDDVYGVEDADFAPKPEKGAFDKVFSKIGLDTSKAAMFEDDARNLLVPFELGMRTVLVHETPNNAAHIHHHTDLLNVFLGQILSGRTSAENRKNADG